MEAKIAGVLVSAVAGDAGDVGYLLQRLAAKSPERPGKGLGPGFFYQPVCPPFSLGPGIAFLHSHHLPVTPFRKPGFALSDLVPNLIPSSVRVKQKISFDFEIFLLDKSLEHR